MSRPLFAAAIACALGAASPARAQEHSAPDAATHEPATHEPAAHEPAAHEEHPAGHEPAAHEEHAAGHEAAAHHGTHSPWELKLTLEAPLFTHVTTDADGSRSTNIGRSFELGVSAGVAYIAIPRMLTIDAEMTYSELFGSELEEGAPHGLGVTLRLGGTYRPVPTVPVYLIAMSTYHLDPFLFGVRGGVGWQHFFGRGVALVLEAVVDFPLAGNADAPGAFKQQTILIATGLLFHL